MCKGNRLPLLELLVRRFPGMSRERLLSWVLCGEVYADGERIRDPRRRVPAAAELERRTEAYVSRAGEKLEPALARFGVEVSGKTILDVGAATGGFTDCLLHYGAAHVHAVDVAHNMLAYKLRSDSRVSVHEKTNARDLPKLRPEPDAVVCDLSFRSLRGVAAGLVDSVREQWGVFLVKPQFERDAARRNTVRGTAAGMGNEYPETDFSGVVERGEEAEAITRELLLDLCAEGAYAHALMLSPVRGRKGNREFLVLLKRQPGPEITTLFSQAGFGDQRKPKEPG